MYLSFRYPGAGIKLYFYLERNLTAMNYTKTRKASSREKLSGSSIKLIGMITMIVGMAATAILDRILLKNGMADIANDADAYSAFMETNGTMFVTDYILQLIGGLAFPLFCFLLVEGFLHTSSLKKYAVGLGIVALVSEIPFDLVYSGAVLNPYRQNPVFSLLLGLGTLVVLEKAESSMSQSAPWKQTTLKLLIAIASCILAVLLRLDYGIFGSLIIVILYMLRDRKVFGMALSCFLLATTSQMLGFLCFLDILPVLFYNGERGFGKKYVFYAVYPVALLIVYAVVLIMGLGSVQFI